jgi:hypothetical protein
MALNPFSPTAPAVAGINPGVYIGTVTRVDTVAGTAGVEVDSIAVDHEFPARYPAGYVPAVGHTVAAAFLEGAREELVVLVRLS